MLKLLSMLLLIFAPIASLASEPGSISGSSRYDTLADWFADGERVRVSELADATSGRCYYAWAPNTARNALLLSMHRDSVANGPGFPRPSRRLMTLFHAGRGAGYFDNISGLELARVRAFARSIWHTHSSPTSTPTAGYLYDFEPNGNWDVRSYIHRYGDYLVLQQVNLIPQIYRDAWTGSRHFVRARDVVTMCYFFREI
jgi:hypothetical protein